MASLLPTPEPPDPVEGALGHFEHSNWVKASLKALDQGTVHVVNGVAEALAVDTVTIDDASSDDAILKLKGNSSRGFFSYTGAGVSRWRMLLGDSTAETSNHTGSLFKLLAYGDDGSLRHAVLSADRQTGLLTVAGDPTAALGIATKQYADTVVPLGTIIAYGGPLPLTGRMATDWHPCDGTTHGSSALQSLLGSPNTPDLRSRFIVGAGQAPGLTNYPTGVGADAGKESVTLTGAQSGVAAHAHGGTTNGSDRSLTHSHGGLTTGMNRNQIHGHSAPGGYDYMFAVDSHAKNAASGTGVTAATGFQNSVNNVDIPHEHGITAENLDHLHAFTTANSAVAPASAAHENRPPYYAVTFIIKKV